MTITHIFAVLLAGGVLMAVGVAKKRKLIMAIAALLLLIALSQIAFLVIAF